MFGLHFLGLNEKERGITNAFNCKKLTRKLCVVYLQVKLQENTCACCINNKLASKHQKQDIYQSTSTNQGGNFAFRCENASRKVWLTFVGAVNQQARYGECSYCLRNSKGAVSQVNNG